MKDMSQKNQTTVKTKIEGDNSSDNQWLVKNWNVACTQLSTPSEKQR